MAPAPPRLVLITDAASAAAAGHDHATAVLAAVHAGVDAVLLRDRDQAPGDRRALGRTLASACLATDTLLIVAGDAALAHEVGGSVLHLGARDPWPTADRWAGPVSRSTHDTDEVRGAVEQGAAFLLAAPVAPTASKPGYGPALGEVGLRRLTDAANGRPVLALGGVVPAEVPRWLAAGAHGVAVMGGVLRAPDPARAVDALRDAIEAASPPCPHRPTRP